MSGSRNLGRELQLALEGCDHRALVSVKGIRALVVNLCERLRVNVREITEHAFDPHGVSVVAILAESHCALHTWPETLTATLDVFTCGDADPISIVPYVTRELAATSAKVTVAERTVSGVPAQDAYPNFPEYVLTEPPQGHFAAPAFRRGVGREFILEPEALAWQSYFTSADYQPPAGKDILLLHPCSWAKPYDFSHFVTQLRETTDIFPRVHRVVLSNVGVVPFEYQMNPFFCSYDYVDLNPERTMAEREAMVRDFRSITAARIAAYIRAHRGNYRAVVVLGHPLPGSYQESVAAAARPLGLPGFVVPTPAAYARARAETAGDRDIDAPLFASATLAEMRERLGALEVYLRGREASGAA